ncbi:hypothetical protein WMY93_022798 [Mugilogobius chulae]|uniref:Nck-associated protein 5 C-terminal domain-containing protein n=1 Tax=Mugilogobius chulae TaxID=88201 RepID=A0AAW0NF08_9GOBI
MAHQSTTVRGPPPSYNQANMQATLPIKDKDCSDFDAGYGTALAPQKLVDKTSQHLQKSPAVSQTKGTSKRLTKDYLPSTNSGSVPEPESKPSKNVPPPYSALRALSGKKGDSPKGKEEKKIGLVLGGKQIRSDKKKEKRNSQQEGPASNLAEVNNKLSTIMDHCNNQMGQIASQIQSSTAFIGKEQLVKEILGRTQAVKGSAVEAPLGNTTTKKQEEAEAEMCHESPSQSLRSVLLCMCPRSSLLIDLTPISADPFPPASTEMLILSQKLNPKCEPEDGHMMDSSCQDHMIGLHFEKLVRLESARRIRTF